MPGSAANAVVAVSATTISSLRKDSGDLIRGDVSIRAQRIDVLVYTTRRGVDDLLAPIDAQARIDGGQDVFHARLFLVVPTGFEALLATAVGATQNRVGFDTRAGKHGRIALVVVITASHVVQGARRAAELAHAHDHGLVEQRLLRICLRLSGREVFNQTGKGRIEFGTKHVVIALGGPVPNLDVMVPSGMADVNITRACIFRQDVAGKDTRDAYSAVAVALSVFIGDLESRWPAGIAEEPVGCLVIVLISRHVTA